MVVKDNQYKEGLIYTVHLFFVQMCYLNWKCTVACSFLHTLMSSPIHSYSSMTSNCELSAYITHCTKIIWCCCLELWCWSCWTNSVTACLFPNLIGWLVKLWLPFHYNDRPVANLAGYKHSMSYMHDHLSCEGSHDEIMFRICEEFENKLISFNTHCKLDWYSLAHMCQKLKQFA